MLDVDLLRGDHPEGKGGNQRIVDVRVRIARPRAPTLFLRFASRKVAHRNRNRTP